MRQPGRDTSGRAHPAYNAAVTTFSRRYALPLLALLLVALVPIAFHALVQPRADECAHPRALLDTDAIEGSGPARPVDKMEPGRIAWIRGRVPLHTRRKVPPLDFAVARTYETEPLYVRPTSFLSEGFEPGRPRVEWVEVDGDRLPLHWADVTATGGVGFSAYLLVYDGRPVTRLFLEQLRTAPSRLLHGATPVTLFAISGVTPENAPEIGQEPARRWLVAAWRHYRESCL